jgi:hypothetical protein
MLALFLEAIVPGFATRLLAIACKSSQINQRNVLNGAKEKHQGFERFPFVFLYFTAFTAAAADAADEYTKLST